LSEDTRPTSKSRVERRKEKTRRKIVTIAVELFREQGFEATAMEQIADEADIAKGTLYNYFPSKEAIITAYVQQSLEEQHADRITLLGEIPDTRARLTAILSDLMERVRLQSDIFEMYLAYRVRNVVSLRPDTSEPGKRAFGSLAFELIRLGQASGEIRTDLPLNMLVDFVEFVFVEVAKQFYVEPDDFDAGTAIEQGVNLFMSGVEEKT